MRNCLIALLLSCGVLCCQQAPNPCNETPISQLQMDRCADFEFHQSDARLNKVYGKVLQYMSDDSAKAKSRNDQAQVDYEQKAMDSLKQAEHAWITYRDAQCNAAAQQYEGGSMSPMIYSQCLTTLTKQRVDALKSIYEDDGWKLE